MNLSRSGNILTVSYRLRNGLPNRSYQVELYVTGAATCPIVYWNLPTQSTDQKGSLSNVVSQDVGGYDQFLLALCACSVPTDYASTIPVLLP